MEERTRSVPSFLVHGLWLLLFFGAPAALAAAYVTQQGEAGFETWKTLAECAVYLLWCGCAVRFFRLTTRRVSSFGVGMLAAAVVSLGLTAAVFLFNNLLHFLQYAVSAGAFCSSPLGYGWFLREDLLYQEGAGPLRYVLAFTTTLMFCFSSPPACTGRRWPASWSKRWNCSKNSFAATMTMTTTITTITTACPGEREKSSALCGIGNRAANERACALLGERAGPQFFEKGWGKSDGCALPSGKRHCNLFWLCPAICTSKAVDFLACIQIHKSNTR